MILHTSIKTVGSECCVWWMYLVHLHVRLCGGECANLHSFNYLSHFLSCILPFFLFLEIGGRTRSWRTATWGPPHQYTRQYSTVSSTVSEARTPTKKKSVKETGAYYGCLRHRVCNIHVPRQCSAKEVDHAFLLQGDMTRATVPCVSFLMHATWKCF